MIRAILFDLDDTLYDESEYVISGFYVVARVISQRFGDEPAHIHQRMLEVLKKNGRGKVFDKVLESYGVVPDPKLIQTLIDNYREHLPTINVFSEVHRILAQLAAEYTMALVTDGLPLMQRKKVQALNVQDYFDNIVYCWDHQAPKPDPTGYELALKAMGFTASEAVIVGDRPDHDLAAAQSLGCAAIRVRRGRFADVDSTPFETIAEITDLIELPNILNKTTLLETNKKTVSD